MTDIRQLPEIVCPVTRATDWERVATFTAPPPVETDFGLSPYHRELWRSPSTGHVVNRHAMDLSALYQGDYWTRTYGDDAAVRRVFERIMGLPADRSDNRGRVAFVDGYCRAHARFAAEAETRVLLDVGAGLAVFPAAMRQVGWRAAALDPDPRAARHADAVAGVEGIVADFMTQDLTRRFPLIAFNKVLEHVPDPVAMLARAAPVLAPGGLVYVELPDAEGALDDPEGASREEFAIEHYCAFSAVSYALLAQRAGFRVERLERLVEPSGKYTLRGFLSRPGAGKRGLMTGGLPPGVVDQPFDAQFLKGPVWRLVDPQAADAAVTAAKVFGVQLIAARLDPVQDLSPHGFRRVETLMTYEGALDPRTAWPEGVRPGTPSDAGACADIAVQAFTFDRWHADPTIPDTAADAFKRAWVENDVRGRADTVLIAEGEGGGVDGFVLVLERERTAIIDLIAVSPRAQGRGVARRLLTALSADCGQRRRYGRAGTQETNLAAARLYESIGWRLADRRIGWHWTPAG